jgi:exopolysaccharide biosynthesis WecB/TagA/CpsF family protein
LLNLPTHTTESRRTITIFGIPFTICTLIEGVTLIEEIIANKEPQLVVLANTHTLNLAYEQSDYKQALKKASIVLRDGIGIGWATRKRGISPLHNFVGTDFIPEFCKYTAHKGYRIFLLGSRSGICQVAAKKLESLAPGIVISGYYHGYFPDEQTTEIVNQINETRADILLVAMGNPKQELWIASNLHRLNVPVCIGVGALFDYLSGRVTRAPRWMLKTKMEWVFRLLVEPKRLWKRYLTGNPKFVIRVYQEYIGKHQNNKN